VVVTVKVTVFWDVSYCSLLDMSPLSALKIKAASFFKMLVNSNQTKRCHSNLQVTSYQISSRFEQ
jgi:hypothetical protein